MAFDETLAEIISEKFREAVTLRLGGYQRTEFEAMLQSILGIKNRRNVQLWTRYGVQTRPFLYKRLGQYELGLREFIAKRFINDIEPSYPVKRKPFFLPMDSQDYQKILTYFNDGWIRAYCSRIFFSNIEFLIEYSADSNVDGEPIDLNSPEFDDVLED